MVVEFSLERYKEKRYFNILLENNVKGDNSIEIVLFGYVGDEYIVDNFGVFYGLIKKKGSNKLIPIVWNKYGGVDNVLDETYSSSELKLLMEDYNRTEMIKK